MNKKVLYVIIAVLMVIVGIETTYIICNKDKSKETLKEGEISKGEIIKYEVQTHEYFSDIPNETMYYIDSVDELEAFYSVYSDSLDIDKEYLKDNIIFIQVEVAGSGSISYKLSSVTIDNNTVNFDIDRNDPGIGTADMAFWYFVAVIPKSQLKDISFSDWKKPTEVKLLKDAESGNTDNYVFELDSKNKFKITTDIRWLTMRNDGGSHDDIYYQIDLENNVVIKIEENYKANLLGKPSTEKNTLYVKKIDDNMSKAAKKLLDNVTKKEDINDDNNYNFFTIESVDYEMDIYNLNTISDIKNLLEDFDNL